jgi:hypothetical protein
MSEGKPLKLRTGIAGTSAVIAVVAASAALAASPAPSGWKTFRANGVSVSLPQRWYATSRALTLVTGPGMDLAIASFPFPRVPRPNGCEPAGTLAKMQPAGALVYLIDYGSESHFAPRPKLIRLAHFARYECFGPSYRITYRDAGRDFQVQVAFGRLATAATRATSLRVANSLRAG